MKTIVVRVLALLVLVIPGLAGAATPAQVDSWKAEFPAAAATDSAALHKLVAGYQLSVNQVKATAPKTLALLKDKLTRDQLRIEGILHPAKPNPSITPAMRADAEAAGKWLNDKFAPYLAKAPR